MRSEGSLTWDEIEKVGVGAAIVAVVGAVFGYFRSIGNKVDKADHIKALTELRLDVEKQIETLNRRHSAWETRSERFATRDLVDALNVKIERMEERQDKGFEKINTRLDKLRHYL